MGLIKKFKMTDEIHWDISQRASKLPKVAKTTSGGQLIYNTVVVDGSKLDRKAMADGSKPKAGLKYSVRELVYENHAVNMVNCFKRGGLSEVAAYEATIKAQKHLMVKEASWCKRMVKQLKNLVK